MANIKYDAFISYSRGDHSWARSLRDQIVLRVFKIFLDEDRIQAGDEWDKKLLTALEESRHFLLLWSQEYTAGSDWVKKEAAAFELLIHQDFQQKQPVGRTFIQIGLQ